MEPNGDWTLWERETTFSFAWNRTHASDRPPGGSDIILDYPTPPPQLVHFGTECTVFSRRLISDPTAAQLE